MSKLGEWPRMYLAVIIKRNPKIIALKAVWFDIANHGRVELWYGDSADTLKRTHYTFDLQKSRKSVRNQASAFARHFCANGFSSEMISINGKPYRPRKPKGLL